MVIPGESLVIGPIGTKMSLKWMDMEIDGQKNARQDLFHLSGIITGLTNERLI